MSPDETGEDELAFELWRDEEEDFFEELELESSQVDHDAAQERTQSPPPPADTLPAALRHNPAP